MPRMKRSGVKHYEAVIMLLSYNVLFGNEARALVLRVLNAASGGIISKRK
jgi:hypothetical protein